MSVEAGGNRESRDTIHGSVPAEAGAGQSTVVDFPSDFGSPRAARRYVKSLLIRWGAESCSDDVVLVVSELCTNAVTHAHSGFTLKVDLYLSGVRVAVHDASPELPGSPTMDRDLPTGRGLWIVSRIARRWGYSLDPGGKEVWAEVAA